MNNNSPFYFSFKESDNNMETIRQSYLNAVNELNQQLLLEKQTFNENSIDGLLMEFHMFLFYYLS
jgi:hypothetical protein